MTPRPLGTWDLEARLIVTVGMLLMIIANAPIIAIAIGRLL